MLLGKLRKSFSCESKSHAIYHSARVIWIAYLWTRAGGVEIKEFYRPLSGHLSRTWEAANRLCIHIYLQKLREWCDFGVFHACFRTCRRIASTSGSFFPKNSKIFYQNQRQRNAFWVDFEQMLVGMSTCASCMCNLNFHNHIDFYIMSAFPSEKLFVFIKFFPFFEKIKNPFALYAPEGVLNIDS